MRISDWSSDVCSSDLLRNGTAASSITIADGSVIKATGTASPLTGNFLVDGASAASTMTGEGAIVRVANGPERLVVRTRSTSPAKIGRASCRERVWQYV